jgi:SWI/SNF-related matrix-associated actin-dependent regulator of chromatin subfamily A member 5
MLLDKLLPKLFAEGHRVLIFSCFTGYALLLSTNARMLNMCEDFLIHRGWTYARLDGSTTRPRRTLGINVLTFANPDIRLFNQENSRILTKLCI